MRTCTSRCPARSPGHWRTASSRRAPTASSRALASGRCPGEKTGFAYSDEVVVPALLQASAAASAIVRQGQQGRVQAWQPRSGPPALRADRSLAHPHRRREGRAAPAHRQRGARPGSPGEAGGREPRRCPRRHPRLRQRWHHGGRCAAARALQHFGDRRGRRQARAGLRRGWRPLRLRLLHA